MTQTAIHRVLRHDAQCCTGSAARRRAECWLPNPRIFLPMQSDDSFQGRNGDDPRTAQGRPTRPGPDGKRGQECFLHHRENKSGLFATRVPGGSQPKDARPHPCKSRVTKSEENGPKTLFVVMRTSMCDRSVTESSGRGQISRGREMAQARPCDLRVTREINLAQELRNLAGKVAREMPQFGLEMCWY
jgi:hypothetical protein